MLDALNLAPGHRVQLGGWLAGLARNAETEGGVGGGAGGGAQWASKAELEAARLALVAQLDGVVSQLNQAGMLGGGTAPGDAAPQGARGLDLGAVLAKALRREPPRLMRAALRRWEGWLSLNHRRAALCAAMRDPAPGRALRTWAAHVALLRRGGAALQRLRQQAEATTVRVHAATCCAQAATLCIPYVSHMYLICISYVSHMYLRAWCAPSTLGWS